MTYFGLISAPLPLAVLAYWGPGQIVVIALWLLLPDWWEHTRLWLADTRTRRPATAHVAHHRIEEADRG